MHTPGFEIGTIEHKLITEGNIEFRRQESLLKTGALQNAIFNSAYFSSIATDEKGVIQIFNVGAERMLGYAALDVVNRITPADISDPLEVIARAKALSEELDTPITPGFEALVFKASRGIEDIYELTYFRKDGSRFPAVVSVTALRDDHNAIIGYLLIGTDNTARKRAEEALLKAGALQSAIFNSANFSSIATDAKGVIQIFNVGAQRMLGYTALEVMNTITPADISDPQEVIARAKALSLELETPITPGFEALVFKASRGIEDIYELTYVRKDGSRFPAIVSVTALRDAHDDIIGYLLIGTDNTARKQVEAAQALLDQRLRDQQFYTRSLIESNLDALMMTDPQGIISDVNQQMVALTGRTRDELIGAPSKKFFTDQTQADAAIKRVLQENKVTDYELTVRALNGVETVVSYNAATFHDRDRKLQGVFAAARDVTERKRFEHTLEVKNIQLERASRMKSEFLATMSHELRTPLNAIIGFSEALKDGFLGQTSALQHECAGDIFSSGLHLLSLINDILDLSKVEAGMMALELDAVDLHALLPDSLTIVREKAAAQNIALSLEVGADLGMPQLDIRKTKQIVYNLLSNAVKFSAHGGAVTLHARRVPRRAVGQLAGRWPVHSFPLADNEYKDFLELCVSDSGIGISEPDMATLFQAFSQIDSSLARKFEGTGLGLAMVRQLAELQGGTVAVASCAGEGSRFAVWLPLRALVPGARPALHGGAAPPASIPAAPPLQAERVALVVEDNDQAAALARLLLEAEGFTVLCAASAEQALELAPRQVLSLITLDIGLPGMDGWQLLQRLRENPALARVPVVVISGIADTSLALSGGAAAMLQKPVNRAQLQASLSGLGLQPSLERTHTVLVAEHDPRAVEAIAGLLPSPAYAIVRAYTGSEAIFLARHMRPDLILLDLMLPDMSGVDVAEALQRDPATARIPILVGAAAQAGEPPRAEKRGLDQARFVVEVRRALLSQ
ncbi:PAS domain S-box protein [Massilia sp. CCM 8695]|uniref:histidine kinase n=1 Tax=Massilia frigida TaxID=2609281 RepID=A0ABX0N3N2_9BURK|nr:PAS domain S-box protein [Massilia frigida]